MLPVLQRSINIWGFSYLCFLRQLDFILMAIVAIQDRGFMGLMAGGTAHFAMGGFMDVYHSLLYLKLLNFNQISMAVFT